MQTENIVRNRSQLISAGPDYTLPEDGWLMLAPYGEFPGVLERVRSGRKEEVNVMQVLNKQSVAPVVAGFEPELLTDYEHNEEDTVAAGWVQNIEARENGLFGQIRWSARGRADVEGGNYRFFSPVFTTSDPVDGRVLPLSLKGNTLTNRPNFRKALPAISNKETPTKEKPMHSKLLALLGLKEDADDAAIEAAVGTIQNKLDAAATLETELQTVKNKNQKLLEAQADADLVTYANVIHNKESVRKNLIENREPTLELLQGLKAKEAPPPSPQHVRNKAKTPDGDGTQADPAKAQARANVIRNKASALRAADPGLTIDDSYRQAESSLED